MKACGEGGDRLRLTVAAMASSKNEFTNVTTLRGEALGEPGKRTFRIVVDSGSSSAVLWLEKEQLFQLALAIQQLLATLRDEQVGSATPPVELEAPGLTRLDFQVSKLVLGHDSSRGLFILDAHEPDEEEVATVRVWASSEQVTEFAEEAVRVCASGRPLCPLCARPIDPTGHQCPRANGHFRSADL